MLSKKYYKKFAEIIRNERVSLDQVRFEIMIRRRG